MPIEGRDRDLLVKCLGMTTSAHDGEALSALRKANGILARLKLTWAEVMAVPAGPAMKWTKGPSYQSAAGSPFEDVWQTTRDAEHAAKDFGDAFDDLSRSARRNREQQRAEARAQNRAQDEQVRRTSISATFELLLKSDRLPPLKRDYFHQLQDRWNRDGKLSMPEEEQLKRAYAVWG